MANDSPARPARKSVKEETLLLNLVKQYFKYAGAVVAIWGFGYWQFSPAWLMLGLVAYVWKEKKNTENQKKIEISQHASKNEKEAILARVEDLPSWVFFPDVERAEWLNKMIDQMWPFIGDYVHDLLMTQIQKTVQDSASVMGSFKFVKIDLGDIPPRIGGVKVYTEHVKRDEIYMDLDIIYSSDSEIEIKLKGITAGIKDLQLHGTVRVIFKPLLSTIPLFGGLSVFFINNPSINFNLTSLANAFDLPGLNDMLQTIIQEQIANIMVLPNRICVQMAPGLDISRIKYPQPDGVLRIHVLEAKDLVKADIALMGKGKSDPYAVIKVGALKFKTKVINNTLEPKWNQVYESIIDEKDGQYMDVEVRDEDPGSKDDSLGVTSIDLSPCSQQGTMDSWLPLENVKKGLVHIKLVWLYLSKDPMMLNKSLEKSKKEKVAGEAELSSCLLIVHLDSARELPRSKKMAEPDAYVELNVGQVTVESNIIQASTDPRWEQGFRFLVHDPNFQTLDLKVMDKNSDKKLGDLSCPLKNLLSAPEMVLDRHFQLKNADGNSQIQMRLALRVLTTEYNAEEWSKETEDLMTEPIPEQPGTNVDTKDTSVDKTASPAPSPPPGEAKVTSTTTEKKIVPAPGQRVAATAPKDVSRGGEKASSAKEPARGGSEGTEMRQRKSASGDSSNLGEYRLGRIQLTLRYSIQRQKLILVVHKCVCLLAVDKDHFSDPYVKVYLLPERKEKRKTKIVNNNLHPVFDETFEFSLTPQELPAHRLEVTVKNDKSMFSSSQVELGVIEINLAELDASKALTEWFDLRPDDTEGLKRAVSIESDV